jgi:acyl carrier protein
MCIHSLISSQRTIAAREGSTVSAVRILIAEHLGVDIERVTDEAHFTDDLGADWLDRLELMIAIEDQFADVEIADDHIDHLDVVGDLIRHIESVSHEKRRRRPVVAELPLQ